jgi:hypothetical protein
VPATLLAEASTYAAAGSGYNPFGIAAIVIAVIALIILVVALRR